MNHVVCKGHTGLKLLFGFGKCEKENLLVRAAQEKVVNYLKLTNNKSIDRK